MCYYNIIISYTNQLFVYVCKILKYGMVRFGENVNTLSTQITNM